MAKVLISGGSGLLGRRLTDLLRNRGDEVVWLSRKGGERDGIRVFEWDPANGTIDEKAIEGVDTVIHLAGAGIADKPWTKAYRKELIDSRVKTGKLLERLIVEQGGVDHFITASGIGGYELEPDRELNEEDPLRDGFVGDIIREWEAVADRIGDKGVKSTKLRIGLVLAQVGGLMKELMRFSFFGIAPVLGNGKQWYSWIHIDDVCGIIMHIMDKQLEGAYNLTAPKAEMEKSIAKAGVKAKRGWAIPMPAPGFALKMVMGERGALVLESAKVSSEKIRKTGYEYKFPELALALKDLFNR